MAEDADDGRWQDLDKLLTRPGNLVGPGFEPGSELREFLQSEDCRVLCIGAGGLGEAGRVRLDRAVCCAA